MTHLWFRAKTYGYGWTPCSWQGWLTVLIAVALYLLPSLVLAWMGQDRVSTQAAITFLLPWYGVITIILIRICASKGEPARWRWGGK